MEYGPADEVFDRPLHPYTHLLLSAAPDIATDETNVRIEMEAEMPENLTETTGCSFQQKCPLNEDRCRDIGQTFMNVGENHWVRCWRAGKNGTLNP
jgi:peptide/nickel transport system ATP-binding protein